MPQKDKVRFGISSLMHFSYGSTDEKDIVVACSFIDRLSIQTYKLSHDTDPKPVAPKSKANVDNKIPIETEKIKDIEKLLP